MSQLTVGRKNFLLFGEGQPFRSIQAFGRLSKAHSHWGRQFALLNRLDSNANLIQKHPHRHTRIMFHQPCGHPIVLLNWCIKLTITYRNKPQPIANTLRPGNSRPRAGQNFLQRLWL